MEKQESLSDEFKQCEIEESYEGGGVAEALVEVKVSSDEGKTWTRRKISMVSGLDESGLCAGEMFQFLRGEVQSIDRGGWIDG